MKEEQKQPEEIPDGSGTWRTNPQAVDLRVDDASAVLDSLPVSVAVYDSDARIRYMNPAGLVPARLTLEQVVGKRDDELFPAHAVNEYRPYLERAFSTRQPVRGECTVRVPARDGREAADVVFSMNYTPVLGPQGELERIIGVAIDLTQLRRLEREASQFKAVQASLGYAVV